MLPNLAQQFVDPITSKPLTLAAEGRLERDGRIESGTLVAADGAKWPIVRGVPRFVPEALLEEAAEDDETADVTSTSRTFGRKWREARSLEYGKNPSDRASMIEVMQHMLRADDEAAVLKKLGDAEAVLNVGCGVAWPEAMYNPSTKTLRCAIDYSLSVETALVRTRDRDNVLVAQADLFKLPFPTSRFDIVFSGGVVHHTPDPAGAVKNLCRHVKPGGLLGFYIYNVKPMLREMADREIRAITTNMSYDDCLELSHQLSLLGKSLQAYREPLKIEADVPLLGIKKGSYNLQKFLYDHFLKCFFNEGQGIELSDLTNLDWYHPKYASHHSKEEVFGWLEEAGMHDMKSTNPPGWEYSSNFITARRK